MCNLIPFICIYIGLSIPYFLHLRGHISTVSLQAWVNAIRKEWKVIQTGDVNKWKAAPNWLLVEHTNRLLLLQTLVY